MYQEIKPSKSIAHIVHRYWRMDAGEAALKEAQVLPDGCFDIVVDIHIGEDNHVLLTGIWDKPQDVTVYSDKPAMGVRFFPAALGAVVQTDIAHIKNISAYFETQMLCAVQGVSFDMLWQSNDAEEIIEFLDYYLVSLNAEGDARLSYLSADLSPGASVAAAARKAFISERQLRRVYGQKLGLSVKNYQSILRFVHAKEMLLLRSSADTCVGGSPGNQTGRSLADIALALGYSDQAHFTKEFKKYAGITPGQFEERWKMSVFYNSTD